MDARYEGPNLSRFLSQDPMFLQVGPADWENSQILDPKNTVISGFASTKNAIYLADPQNLDPYRDPSGKCFEDFRIAEALFLLRVVGTVQTLYDTTRAFNTFAGSG